MLGGGNAGRFDLAFGKQSSSQTHTMSGLVSELHSSAEFDNPNDFLKFVTTMHDMDIDPRRYNIVDYMISLDNKFGEYCIKYYYMTEDYKAPNRGYKDNLAFNISGYTFIHPYFHDIILDINYSERGLSEEIDQNFHDEAKKFIDGISLKVFED